MPINKALLDEQYVNNLLTKAERYSARAGFSWALLDCNYNLLNCDGVIAGSQPEKLIHQINLVGHNLHRIMFSLEPTEEVVKIGQLIREIEATDCAHITICHSLSEDQADFNWRFWSHRWQGNIDYLSKSQVARKLASAIEMHRSASRPWITAVGASHFNGSSIPLDHFINEFGFQSHLHQMMLQTRVVLCADNQARILSHLPDQNVMGEKIEIYLVSDPLYTLSILDKVTKNNCFNALVFCDSPLLDHFLNQKMVDEIIYHLSNLELFSDASLTLNEHDIRFAFSSSEWKIVSSAVTGTCNRILFNRHSAEDINITSTPRHGFN